MKRVTLDLLACPDCQGELTLQGGGDVIETSSLLCSGCGKMYPIANGIPQFIQQSELTGMNRKFSRMYDWFSHVYALYSRICFAFMGGESRNRHEILDRLDPQQGRALEVSIGPGINLPYLAAMPGITEIYGLDISPGQLARCRSFCRRKGYAAELFLGSAEQLPFKDEAFAIVFHIGGINFFNDKKKAIDEMIRVARPGTRIIIVDENERGATSYEWTLPGFKRAFEGRRSKITAPVDLVPCDMEEVRLVDAWHGWFYSLEFRKPRP